MAFMRSGVRSPSSPPIESITYGNCEVALFLFRVSNFAESFNFDFFQNFFGIPHHIRETQRRSGFGKKNPIKIVLIGSLL